MRLEWIRGAYLEERERVGDALHEQRRNDTHLEVQEADDGERLEHASHVVGDLLGVVLAHGQSSLLGRSFLGTTKDHSHVRT